MKILQIRFCNLNSLAGSWSINLTAREYSANGIFAITGPTGAGKTTILDAICLALYGKTPRLERVNKASNEIMTRQTGECWAEVEFSTGRGNFRCHWAQHRSRKAANGDLQPSRHEIVDAGTGKVLESRKKQVEQKIIEVTGMSYEQFTRSIMLAQGEFNNFLNARPDDRAPILEQITGTEIYSRISRKVHEIRSRTQSRLEQLQKECDGFMPLQPEQVQEIENRRQELLQNSQEIETKVKSTQQLLDWLHLQEQLSQELATQEQRLQSAATASAQLAPQRRLLERADLAEKLRPGYDQLQQTRKLQEKESREYAQTLKDNEVLAASAHNSAKEREKLKKVFSAREAEDKELAPVVKRVRELDKELSLTDRQYKDFHGEREAALRQQTALAGLTRTVMEKLATLDREHASIAGYFASNRRDRQLVAELSGIEQHSSSYLKLISAKTKLDAQIADAAQKLKQSAGKAKSEQTHHEKLSEQLRKLQAAEQDTRDKLAALLDRHSLVGVEQLFQTESKLQQHIHLMEQLAELHRQLSAEMAGFNQSVAQLTDHYTTKTSLKSLIATTQQEHQLRTTVVRQQERTMRLAARVQSLEQERRTLRPGDPCPLCGATEHPYVSSPCPEIDVEEKLFRQEQALLEQTTRKLNQLTTELAATSARIEQLEQNRADRQRLIEINREKADQLALQLELPVGQDLNQHLQKRLAQFNFRLKELRKLQDHCLQLKKDAEALSDKLEATNRQVTDADRSLQKLRYEHEHQARVRDQLLQQQQELHNQQLEQVKLLEDHLIPYLKSSVPETALAQSLPKLLSELKARKERWLAAESREQQIAVDLQKLNSEKARLEAQAAATAENLATGLKRLTELQKNLDRLSSVRKELLGEQDPDMVEKERSARKKQLEEQARELNAKHEALLREQARLAERQSGLKNRISDREIELQRQAKRFLEKLQASAFADESEYLAAVMEPEQLSRQLTHFAEQEKELEKLRHLLQNTRAKLEREQQKKLTEKTADKLKEELQRLAAEFRKLTEETGAIAQQLKSDEEQRRLHQQKLTQLTRQGETLEHWSQLHELIGSADGKKFRNFAQGLTFELMIHHANLNLQQMSDRYLLVHNAQDPLELQVIDNYQAGEIRSTKNLSGGESFIVSMALALGLSNMAGSKVQVDSLFLDEGFGTLDDEALQTALDTLSSLHQRGKLIGVISHVSGLQERIATRIQVTKGLGGLSSLSGPGIQAGG